MWSPLHNVASFFDFIDLQAQPIDDANFLLLTSDEKKQRKKEMEVIYNNEKNAQHLLYRFAKSKPQFDKVSKKMITVKYAGLSDEELRCLQNTLEFSKNGYLRLLCFVLENPLRKEVRHGRKTMEACFANNDALSTFLEAITSRYTPF